MHYYLLVEGLKKGPIPLEELKENGLSAETLVWREGLTEWVKASELEELSEVLASIPPCPPSSSQPEENVKQPECPKTWLPESIISTCLCCLPLGIVAIVYAVKVDSAYLQGNYEQALQYSKLARNWTLAAAGSALLIAVLYVIFIFMMILLGKSSFDNSLMISV